MIGLGSPVALTMRYSRRSGQASYYSQIGLATGCVPESALTPVDISVDNDGEAGAVPVDALGDTAAGAVASYFRASPECHQGVNRRPKDPGNA